MKIALALAVALRPTKRLKLCACLQDRGIRVQVIMTQAAQEFIRPLTFAALSGEKVITGMFDAGAECAQHRFRRRTHRRRAIHRCAAGGPRHRRRARQVRARHCQRFPHHPISGDHRARRRGSRHERQHVEPSRDSGESRDPPQARRQSRRSRRRLSGLRHDRPGPPRRKTKPLSRPPSKPSARRRIWPAKPF